MSSDSDAIPELLDQLRNGDADALAALFSIFRDRLKKIVHFRLSEVLSTMPGFENDGG